MPHSKARRSPICCQQQSTPCATADSKWVASLARFPPVHSLYCSFSECGARPPPHLIIPRNCAHAHTFCRKFQKDQEKSRICKKVLRAQRRSAKPPVCGEKGISAQPHSFSNAQAARRIAPGGQRDKTVLLIPQPSRNSRRRRPSPEPQDSECSASPCRDSRRSAAEPQRQWP